MTRHATDLASLAFGLLFAAIAAVLLADQRLAISTDWLAPVVAIGFGAILIAAGARRRASAEEVCAQESPGPGNLAATSFRPCRTTRLGVLQAIDGRRRSSFVASWSFGSLPPSHRRSKARRRGGDRLTNVVPPRPSGSAGPV
jgi:hypothetical protein